jgi:MFS family permease
MSAPSATLSDSPVAEATHGEPVAHELRAGTLWYTRKSLAILFFWLLAGDFCYMLMETVFPSIMPLMFKELGASNFTMAVVLGTIPMGINIVLNPIVSFRSDRCRSRWGRRIPYILFTIPVLVVSLIAMGYGRQIGEYLHRAIGLGATPERGALIAIAVIVVIFSLFNSVVNAVFWYLFNDVVPEHLLARFMSWFRLVSVGAVSAYNLFIFGHADKYASEILAGAALLYLVGFGLMCLNVREGTYAPPPPYLGGAGENRINSTIAAIKTYARECHSLLHYCYVFAAGLAWGGYGATTVFALFFYQSTGLTLEQVGRVLGIANALGLAAILASGWLADRFHPIRVVIGGLLLQLLVVTPLTSLWLFTTPSPAASYWIWMIVTICASVPALALINVFDPPMLMRVFPRERYGQFCSANALWRSLAVLVSAMIVGGLFDLLKNKFGDQKAFAFLPLIQGTFLSGMLVAILLLYRSWKRHGGDRSYVPPMSGDESSPRGFSVEVKA